MKHPILVSIKPAAAHGVAALALVKMYFVKMNSGEGDARFKDIATHLNSFFAERFATVAALAPAADKGVRDGF